MEFKNNNIRLFSFLVIFANALATPLFKASLNTDNPVLGGSYSAAPLLGLPKLVTPQYGPSNVDVSGTVNLEALKHDEQTIPSDYVAPSQPKPKILVEKKVIEIPQHSFNIDYKPLLLKKLGFLQSTPSQSNTYFEKIGASGGFSIGGFQAGFGGGIHPYSRYVPGLLPSFSGVYPGFSSSFNLVPAYQYQSFPPFYGFYPQYKPFSAGYRIVGGSNPAINKQVTAIIVNVPDSDCEDKTEAPTAAPTKTYKKVYNKTAYQKYQKSQTKKESKGYAKKSEVQKKSYAHKNSNNNANKSIKTYSKTNINKEASKSSKSEKKSAAKTYKKIKKGTVVNYNQKEEATTASYKPDITSTVVAVDVPEVREASQAPSADYTKTSSDSGNHKSANGEYNKNFEKEKTFNKSSSQNESNQKNSHFGLKVEMQKGSNESNQKSASEQIGMAEREKLNQSGKLGSQETNYNTEVKSSAESA